MFVSHLFNRHLSYAKKSSSPSSCKKGNKEDLANVRSKGSKHRGTAFSNQVRLALWNIYMIKEVVIHVSDNCLDVQAPNQYIRLNSPS
jgi:hypothetical protein